MSGFERLPLAELVIDDKRRGNQVDDEVWNLNLDQIQPNSGRILEKVRVPTTKLGPSTYQFTAGTVLYSKLRPYLNKVVLADEDGFATTELVPLRCNPDRVLPSYLASFLRSSEFLNFANTVVAGSKMPRMVMSKFWRYEVPVPPLSEQRRIAAILDKAEALRSKRREALAQLDRLAQSIFVEMFGTYEKGQIRWTTIPLAELASDMKIGVLRSSEEFGDDFGFPYVRMNAVGRSGEFLRELVQKTDVTEEELEEYCLQQGDILFNTRNSKELVGKTAIFRETGEYVYNNNLMRLRFHGQVDAEYMAQCFLTPFMRQELEFRKSGTTSVFAIYARDVCTVQIPEPPIELPREFSKRRQALYRTSLKMAAQEQETTRLFAALQHRAFQGEL